MSLSNANDKKAEVVAEMAGGSADDDEYIEEEIEVDASDDDEDDGDQLSTGVKTEAASKAATDDSSMVDVAQIEVPLNVAPVAQASQPRQASSGRVRVPSGVRDVVARTPGITASRSGPPQPAKISLFNTGDWTKKTFSDVKIIFPTLGTANETTNDLTRSTRPEARHWKGDIKFSLGAETSSTIRIFNVAVPFSDNVRYGSEFVYMCLPSFMADAFAEAGKTKRPTVAGEASIMNDANRWWKIANDVTDKFGIGNAQTKSFKPINIQTLLVSTQKGLIVNAELKFQAKAGTIDKAKLTATNPQKIAVQLIRAYIVKTDEDIELPSRVAKVTNAIKPGATKDDFASDQVMARLKALGL